MAKFVINGGKKLEGEIKVSGSKNATFPLFAASLLTKEECKFTNVPQIKDKEVIVDILKDLGAEVTESSDSLSIRAASLTKTEINGELASKLRGSIVLLGGLLGRMHKAKMNFPGGDMIGKRPIEAHLAVFQALGAEVSSNGAIEISAGKLIGNKIVMEESSVTATENAILAASLAEGTTVIKLAAMEPHVQQLCEFLNSMGAKISGIGTPTIKIEGVQELHGAQTKIIADSEQAASLITLAAATRSNVRISNLNPDFLEDYLMKLKMMNVNFEVGDDYVKVMPPTADYVGTKIQAGLYPKLNSDFIPPMSVLATQSSGESLMHEWMYENRQSYVESLVKMGADAKVLDKDRVLIKGPTPLHGEKITTYDLRQGLTLVIAALVADGESEISDIHHIDRGYENLEERLSAIGADIKRVS